MADEAAPDVESSAPAKKPGEFARFYVFAMAALALFLGYMWLRGSAEADDYRRANDQAKVVFGDAPANAAAGENSIRGLAVGVIKYLETSKAGGKTEGDIPVKAISESETGEGLSHTTLTQASSQKNEKHRYEEISVNVIFEKADLEHLSRFLYDLERRSSNLRILEVHWELLPEKENEVVPGASPPKPGHLIARPRVKIGFRKPYAGNR